MWSRWRICISKSKSFLSCSRWDSFIATNHNNLAHVVRCSIIFFHQTASLFTPLFISLSYRSFPHYLIFPSPSSHYVLLFILFTFLSRGLHVFSHFDISHLYHAQCYFFPFGGTLTFRKNIQIFSCLNGANKAGMSWTNTDIATCWIESMHGCLI